MSSPATIPGTDADTADEFRSADLRVTRLLVFLTSLSAIALALTAILGVNLIVRLLNGGDGGVDVEQECTEEFDECGENMACVLGECVEIIRSTTCQVGDACSRPCQTDGTLRCDKTTNLYTVSAQYDQICDDVQVTEFIEGLEKKCGDAQSCKSSDFEKFAISMNDFWELLSRFPKTLAVHYPYGRPYTSEAKRRKTKWPSAEEAEHYTSNIKTIIPAIDSADFVLLVATASRDKIPGQSDEITYLRAKQTQELINQAIDNTTPDRLERERLKNKLKVVKIGEEKQLEASEFRRFFGSRSVAWNASTQEQLRGLLQLGDKLKNRKSRVFRDRTINQTVFIVPIPCSKAPDPIAE